MSPFNAKFQFLSRNSLRSRKPVFKSLADYASVSIPQSEFSTFTRSNPKSPLLKCKVSIPQSEFSAFTPRERGLARGEHFGVSIPQSEFSAFTLRDCNPM